MLQSRVDSIVVGRRGCSRALFSVGSMRFFVKRKRKKFLELDRYSVCMYEYVAGMKGLNTTDRLVLSKIVFLDNGQNHCYAHNRRFASYLNVTRATISKSINKLIRLKHVEIVRYINGEERVLKHCLPLKES